MTYCLAVAVDQGLVFASDSRTNAGVDQLSTYSKMFRFIKEDERLFVILTAGNLATTQAVVKQIERDMQSEKELSLWSVQQMDEAAEYIGDLSVTRQRKHSDTQESGVDISAHFIVGGQIAGQAPEIYMVYPEGNYIAATSETPYQQIGETKYGKPILDRIIKPETFLSQAVLCALVSMDSTMRSNATVGPPIELFIQRRDVLKEDIYHSFARDDAYLIQLRAAWQENLAEAFARLPQHQWSVPLQNDDGTPPGSC